MKPFLLSFCIAGLAGILSCFPVFAGESSNSTHTLLASAYSCSQGISSGSVYVVKATLGEQATTGKSSGGNYSLYNSIVHNAIPEPFLTGNLGLFVFFLLRKHVCSH